MHLYCNTCSQKLTENSLELAPLEEVSLKDETRMLSIGMYTTWDHINKSEISKVSEYLVDKSSIELKGHSDHNRYIGCCGSGEGNLPNQVCPRCSAEIGVIVDDCMTPHYVKIIFDKISHEPLW